MRTTIAAGEGSGKIYPCVGAKTRLSAGVGGELLKVPRGLENTVDFASRVLFEETSSEGDLAMIFADRSGLVWQPCENRRARSPCNFPRQMLHCESRPESKMRAAITSARLVGPWHLA